MVTVLRCVAYKSFTTLINTSYSMKDGAGQFSDVGVLSSPLSFIRSGHFGITAEVDSSYRGGGGEYWILRSTNTTNSYYLYFDNGSIIVQYTGNRGSGFAVRCVPNP